MRLEAFMAPLKNNDKFKKLVNYLKKDKVSVGVNGISDSAKSYMINGMLEEMNKSLIVVTHNDVEARNIYEDLGMYTTEVHYFPTKEVVFYNIDAISGDLRWARLKVIKEMLKKDKNKIVVTSIENLISLYSPLELFNEYSFNFKIGDEINLKDLSKKFIESGYEKMQVIDGKGQFAIKGGIMDIFPPNSSYPYRVELFGDEIDSIRTFNLESQRSIEKIQKIEVFPAKEIILNEESIKIALNKMQEELDETINLRKETNLEAVEKIKNIVKHNMENLKETWSFETMESYLPYFFDKSSTFFDFIENCLFIIDDPLRCNGKLDSTLYEFNQNYEDFLERGSILPLQGNLLLSKEVVLDNLNAKSNVLINGIQKSNNFIDVLHEEHFSQVTLNGYQGKIELLIEDIKNKKQDNLKILILSGTRARGERLADTLRDKGIESVYKDVVRELHDGEVVITFGNQNTGFDFKDLNLSVISDKEIFGEAKKVTRKKASKQKGVAKIKSFAELNLGDYVVHANHGIGVYKGIKQIDAGGHKRDYLDLEYAKGDKLYVPVDQLDLVQKYIGSEGKTPKINKLGGNDWQKAKAKVKKSINEIAEDLVKLYATRANIKGFKFGKDTQWQRQFEDEFPYEETPDQLTSLDDIKKDMESTKVMDRLLCGDVGYGKTEVAIRAAFKAVMDSKQVAFLVPTTILAEQHYNNLKKRFFDFPVNIDMISRFRTAKQQRETLQSIKEHNVDILIGTHKLVSKDIEFKDLGLLIVDEEQRFGVTQKEKIKNLKKNVDVLTLSATPIPRTLHMSLTGARDISVIETPPEERYPIQTYVTEYNDQLIRDAILREKNRDGQTFFVYNRVESIQEMANYLSNLIPECRVTVIHGQMTERQLEKEMIAFMNKEYDILLCTTIIETGIDIQNVNTMIVYDSDKMGLSQLYQLRGRVGRSNKVAYAYFVYKKDKILTEVAEKRLKALKDFTELGSGFKIAMRDLEIRGAGNMMGSAQHGHMATIGYDLYCRMLEDTIKIIKGDIEEEPIETTIDLKVDAYIPSSYISDEIQKIEVYKKIAAIENIEEYKDIREELEDRYSKIPESVSNLMDIAYIKATAKHIGVEEIKEKKDEIIFQLKNRDKIKYDLFKSILENYKDSILIKFGDKPYFIYRIKDVKKEELLSVLKELVDFIGKIKK